MRSVFSNLNALTFISLSTTTVSVSTIMSQSRILRPSWMYYGWRVWWNIVSILTWRSLWSSTWPNQQCSSLWNLHSSSSSLTHQKGIMVILLLHQIISSVSIKWRRCSFVSFNILFAFSFHCLHILYSVWPIIQFLGFLTRLFIIFPSDTWQGRIVVLSTNSQVNIHFTRS